MAVAELVPDSTEFRAAKHPVIVVAGHREQRLGLGRKRELPEDLFRCLSRPVVKVVAEPKWDSERSERGREGATKSCVRVRPSNETARREEDRSVSVQSAGSVVGGQVQKSHPSIPQKSMASGWSPTKALSSAGVRVEVLKRLPYVQPTRVMIEASSRQGSAISTAATPTPGLGIDQVNDATPATVTLVPLVPFAANSFVWSALSVHLYLNCSEYCQSAARPSTVSAGAVLSEAGATTETRNVPYGLVPNPIDTRRSTLQP